MALAPKKETDHISANYKVQVSRLAARGNKPEEWKEYIDVVKSRVHLLDESAQKSVIDHMYFTAFKVMPDSPKTLAYANIVVDYADFKSKYDVTEAEKLLTYARRTLRRFAIVHIASAELELKRENKEKAIRILQRAHVSDAEQEGLLKMALQRANEGKMPLFADDMKENKTGTDTSPTTGRETSEELNSSLLSGHIGESSCRDLLKLSLSGCRSNTQEVQQGLDILTRHQVEPLQPGHKLALSSSAGLKTPSPPKFVNDFARDLMRSSHEHRDGKGSHGEIAAGRQSEGSTIHRQPLASLRHIPEMPDSRLPSSAKKSLPRFYSTPILDGRSSGFGSSMKSSVRKFNVKKDMPPPRRVKVDSALKSTSDDEDNDSQDISMSSFRPFDAQPTRHTATDVSKTHESMEINSEPLKRMQMDLGNPLNSQTRHSKNDSSSLILSQSKPSTVEMKWANSNNNNNNNFRENKSVDGERHRSLNENIADGPGSAAETVRGNLAKPFHPVASAHVEAKPAQGVESTASFLGGSARSAAGQPQSSEQEQQRLVQVQQQLLQQQQQQQQQMKQIGAGNPTYSVHSQNPCATPADFITPAKQTMGTGQKTLLVNGRPYTVIRLVGRGGSAKVYQVYDAASSRICALKVVNLSCANRTILEGYKNEIALLKKLQHCNRVIKLFDSEFHEPTQKLLLVLEYGESDLDKFIAQNTADHKQLHPITICHIWLQLVTAVQAMHKEGVIHSDLKPPNFILVAGNVKLIDFGIANSIQQDSTSILKDIRVGTPSYMSPEMLEANTTGPADNKPRYKVGMRSDVWSLGCILYQMVYRRTPFQNVPNKTEAIINPNYPIEFPDLKDQALMDVLKKCLQRDVRLRPTTEELLKHPYLQKGQEGATSPAPQPTPLPSLASKLSLLETVFSSASPRTKEALGNKLKTLSSDLE